MRRLGILYKGPWFLLTAAALVTFGGWGGWFFGLRSPAPFPAALIKETAFPLYYPPNGTNGYTIDFKQATYDPTNNVLLFTANNKYNHRITISEQPMPRNLSFDTLLGNGSTVNNTIGQAALNNVEERNVLSIIGPGRKTLILFNSDNASQDEITSLARALRSLE